MLQVVFTFLDAQGIRLLPWQFPGLSPIKNIWSSFAERLSRHSFPANTAEEVFHRLEATGNELPISVIQAQFDSIPNCVRAVLVASRGSSLY
ncbi:hypothetical protein TNCV_635251 [Trichonephila clavipes]|nr:hypothetical protein TNCV_635251 [Trichonephila clavipes]